MSHSPGPLSSVTKATKREKRGEGARDGECLACKDVRWLGRRNVRIAPILRENTSGAGNHVTRAPEAKEKMEETCLLRKLGHHGPHLRQGVGGGGAV